MNSLRTQPLAPTPTRPSTTRPSWRSWVFGIARHKFVDHWRRAVELGATSSMAPTDQPHGARSATIIDPHGHRWMVSQQLTTPDVAEIDAAYDGFSVTES
jgi:DNA-directed RNA polymerase specialized sigma24 family protein